MAVNYNRSKEAAEEVVRSIKNSGGEAIAIHADVADEEQANAMVDRAVEVFGGLDILVNNAGTLIEKAHIESMSTETWEGVLGANLTGTFFVSRAAIPRMRGREGAAIVNVSSIVARIGIPDEVHYSVSKAGVSAFTRGLAAELAKDGIRVNALAPGVTATEFHIGHTEPDVLESVIQGIPIPRAGTSEEMARLIVMLLSPWAAYMTGEVVEVNGGVLMA